MNDLIDSMSSAELIFVIFRTYRCDRHDTFGKYNGADVYAACVNITEEQRANEHVHAAHEVDTGPLCVRSALLWHLSSMQASPHLAGYLLQRLSQLEVPASASLCALHIQAGTAVAESQQRRCS